jgi:ParB family chromosome partitioning protein
MSTSTKPRQSAKLQPSTQLQPSTSLKAKSRQSSKVAQTTHVQDTPVQPGEQPAAELENGDLNGLSAHTAPDGVTAQKGVGVTASVTQAPLTTTDLPAEETAWQVVWLPVGEIAPNPYQPRTGFDPQEMLELVASVRAHGVLQPVTVRTLKPEPDAEPAGSNGHAGNNGHAKRSSAQTMLRYHLVSGERRLRACKEANRKFVPAIIRDDLSDGAVAELALIENVQRSNLNVMEEAAAYKRLMLEFRLKEERLAKKVGKSAQTIKDLIKLLALPKEVQPLIAGKQISVSHGQLLLKLAPFERVCVQVAQYAVQHKVTATALELALLPNARALKEQKLLVELGHKTAFDWKSECGNCPHKAYVASGYSSYCLRPEEWQKKQDAAIEQQQQEAARVMEEARQEGKQVVEVEKLPANSYRNLSYMSILPAGCSGACPCRGEAADPRDPTQRIPICLQPERFSELVRAEREAQEDARRQHYEVQWKEALEVLQAEWTTSQPRKTVWLMARPLLQPSHYFPNPEVWPQLLQYVADALELQMPVEALASLADGAETSQVLELLQGIEPNHLLLFTAGLQLALEAQNGSHYGGETADLDLVLERSSGLQTELPEDIDEVEPDQDIQTAEETEPENFESGDNSVENDDATDDEQNDEEHEWYWPEGQTATIENSTIEPSIIKPDSGSREPRLLAEEHVTDTSTEELVATTS